MAKTRYDKYKALKKYITSKDGLAVVEQMAMDNMTLKEMSLALGVPRKLFGDWIKENEKLEMATQRTSKLMLAKVEAALYQSAIGAKTRSVSSVSRLRKGKDGVLAVRQTEKVVTEETQAPNTKAAIYILDNRLPDKWSSKPGNNEEAPDTSVTINVVRAENNTDEIVNSAYLPDEQEEKFYEDIHDKQERDWKG